MGRGVGFGGGFGGGGFEGSAGGESVGLEEGMGVFEEGLGVLGVREGMVYLVVMRVWFWC